MKSRDQTVRPEGSKSTVRRRKRSPSGSSNSEGSIKGSSSSSHRNKKERRYQNRSRDEFKKAKPPTFDGEVKNGQEAEAWLLGMRKYFQVQYPGNMKAMVSIFNLTGRASIWWGHFRKVKKINERNIVWKQLQNYLSDKYYDDKIKEFHEIILGQQTMEEYAKRSLNLLRYVKYMIR